MNIQRSIGGVQFAVKHETKKGAGGAEFPETSFYVDGERVTTDAYHVALHTAYVATVQDQALSTRDILDQLRVR